MESVLPPTSCSGHAGISHVLQRSRTRARRVATRDWLTPAMMGLRSPCRPQTGGPGQRRHGQSETRGPRAGVGGASPRHAVGDGELRCPGSNHEARKGASSLFLTSCSVLFCPPWIKCCHPCRGGQCALLSPPTPKLAHLETPARHPRSHDNLDTLWPVKVTHKFPFTTPYFCLPLFGPSFLSSLLSFPEFPRPFTFLLFTKALS